MGGTLSIHLGLSFRHLTWVAASPSPLETESGPLLPLIIDCRPPCVKQSKMADSYAHQDIASNKCMAMSPLSAGAD